MTTLFREQMPYAEATRGFLRAGRELLGIGYYGMEATVLRDGRAAAERFLQAGLAAQENRQIGATLTAIAAELEALNGGQL